MPDEVQRESGCVIGEDYPGPIVDRKRAREEALDAIPNVKTLLRCANPRSAWNPKS